MLRKWLFDAMSETRRLSKIRRKGVILGTRMKNGRRFHFYLLNGLFLEVLFSNDDADAHPEKLRAFARIDEFNEYLTREFRAAF